MDGCLIAILIFVFSLMASLVFIKIADDYFKDRGEWQTLSQLYRLHHSKKMGLGWTALAGVFTFFNYLFSDGRFFYVGGIVKNGYTLVFLSPFVLIYWMAICILYVIVWECILVALILTALWAVFFELPANALNMGKPKPQKRARRRRARKTTLNVIGKLQVSKEEGKP